MSREPTSDGQESFEEATAPQEASAAGSFPSLKPIGAHEGVAPIPLHRPITMVGSRKTARLHLRSPRVSKAHALIVVTPTKAYICDLLSREGTRIKGHAVKELELRDGDDVEIAQFKFRYQDPRPRSKAPPPQVEPLALQIDASTGKQRIVLEKRVTLIGRRYGSDVHLPLRDVSTANTAIIRLDGFAGQSDSLGFAGWAVFDLGGKGTSLNGVPVHKARINAGDVLTIGSARVQVVLAPQDAGEQVSLEDRPVAAARTAPLAPAAGALDLDEIKLDEELTPAGLEEDLLGGSHVMEAIREPEAPDAPGEPQQVAAEDDLLEDAGGDTAAFDADSLRADEPVAEENDGIEADESVPDELPARGWRSTTEDDALAGDVPPEQAGDATVAEAASEDLVEADAIYTEPQDAAVAQEPDDSPDEVDWSAAEAVGPAPHDEPAAPTTDDAAHEGESVAGALGEAETEPLNHNLVEELVDPPAEVGEALADEPEVAAAGAWDYAPDAEEMAADAAEAESALAEWDQRAAAEFDIDAVEGEEPELEASSERDEGGAAIEVPEIDLSQLDFAESAPASSRDASSDDTRDARVHDDPATLPEDADFEAMAESAQLAETAPAAETEDDERRADNYESAATDERDVPLIDAVGDSGSPAGIEQPAFTAEEREAELGIDMQQPVHAELEETADDTAGAELGLADEDEEPAGDPPRPLFGEFAAPHEEEEDFADIAESVAEHRSWIRAPAHEEVEPEAVEAESPPGEPEPAIAEDEPESFVEPALAGDDPLTAPDEEAGAGRWAALSAGDSEMVIEETQPTPESALDLEALAEEAGHEEVSTGEADEIALDEAALAAPDDEPALSDSALAMELEALSEESRPEPLANALDEHALADADDGREARLSDDEFAGVSFEENALAPDESPGDFPAQPAEAVGSAPATAQEPDAPRPEIAARDAGARAAEARPGGGDADAPAQQPPAARQRTRWRVQQDSFLGNAVPLVGSDFSVPKSPVGYVPHISGRQRDVPPVAKSQHAIEQVPEGLADDKAAGAARASAARKSESAPQQPPVVADDDDGFEFVLDEDDDPAPAAGSPPESPGTSGGPQKPPRPQKIGFGGPVVADLHEALAPGAANPFSSNPVGSQSYVLDPSAVMPEASGLVDLTSSARAEQASAAREPLMQSSPQAEAIGGEEAVWDENLPAGEESETELDSSGDADRDAASALQEPTHSARGRIIEEPSARQIQSANEQTDQRVGDFLRTIRGGVRSGDAPALHDRNGNGQMAQADAPARSSEPAQPSWKSAPETLHAPPETLPDLPLSEPMIAEPVAPRRRMLWLVPLLIGLAFVAAIGAVAGIWYGMQPSAPVVMKVRYDVPNPIDEALYREYREGQLARLLDDSLRLAALDALQKTSPQVPPGFLADVERYNQFALSAHWSPDEPNAVVLSRSVPLVQRAAESARLKAVATALYDRGGTERAARARYLGEAEQLLTEIDKLRRDYDELNRQINEAVASLPAPDSTSAHEAELESRIARFDEQWTGAGRRVSQLKQDLQSARQSDPLAEDQVLADLRRQLAELEARVAGSGGQAGADRSGAEEAFPAAGLFDDPENGSGEEAHPSDEEMPLASEPAPGTDGAASVPSGGAAATDIPTGDPRKLREDLDARLSRLSKRAADLAGRSGAPAAGQLAPAANQFESAVRSLLEETLPAQSRMAGEVELLRQSLAKVRRERSVALLEEDERVAALRAEVGLRERELNAAISDGLAERAAALRLAHRMSRDRLSMRVEEVLQQLESDARVISARQTYEQAEQKTRGTLLAQRRQAETAIASARRALQDTIAPGDPLAADAAELESAALGLARLLAARLPLLAEVWSGRADDDASAEEPDAGEASGGASGTSGADHTAVHLIAEAAEVATGGAAQDEAQQLRRQIAARESELRQAHEQKVADLSEQLVAAEAAAAKAQREAQEARSQLAELRARQDGAQRQRQRVAQLRVQRVDLESAISVKEEALGKAQAAGGVLATPRPPADVDIQMPLPPDHRPRAIVMALLGIAAVTLIGLFFTLRTASRA